MLLTPRDTAPRGRITINFSIPQIQETENNPLSPYRSAERLLHEEFAYVLEIPVPEVPAYIESQI